MQANVRGEIQQLREMFPELDQALIEDVLQANNWNVESAINFFLPSSYSAEVSAEAASMIDSQSGRTASLSALDEEGVSLAWISASEQRGPFDGEAFSSPDIPLEYTSEERQVQPPSNYSSNSSVSVAADNDAQPFDVLSAMRAKAMSLLQVHESNSKAEQLAAQHQQERAEAEAAARLAAKEAKRWPKIKHLHTTLGDFSCLPEDMAISVFRNLSATDLSTICQVSKQAKIYFNSGFWWRMLVYVRFGKWDGQRLWWGRTTDLRNMSWKTIYLKLHNANRVGSITYISGGSSIMWIVRGHELRRIGGLPALFNITQSQPGHRAGPLCRSMPPPFAMFRWDGTTLSGHVTLRITWNKSNGELSTFSGGSYQRATISESTDLVTDASCLEKQSRDEAFSAATAHGLHPRSVQWSEQSNGHPKSDNSGLTWAKKTRFVKSQHPGGGVFKISGDVPIPFIMAAVFRLDTV